MSIHFRCNVYFLWLPQIVTQLMNYSANHPDFGVTMCYVVQLKEAHYNSTNMGEAVTEECVVNVPVDTYYVSTLMGISQFFLFIVSGSLTKITGNNILLGEPSCSGAEWWTQTLWIMSNTFVYLHKIELNLACKEFEFLLLNVNS